MGGVYNHTRWLHNTPGVIINITEWQQLLPTLHLVQSLDDDWLQTGWCDDITAWPCGGLWESTGRRELCRRRRRQPPELCSSSSAAEDDPAGHLCPHPGAAHTHTHRLATEAWGVEGIDHYLNQSERLTCMSSHTASRSATVMSWPQRNDCLRRNIDSSLSRVSSSWERARIKRPSSTWEPVWAGRSTWDGWRNVGMIRLSTPAAYITHNTPGPLTGGRLWCVIL